MGEVHLSRRAVKDLDALPKRTATRVIRAFEQLAADPESESLDVKALVGKKPWRRLRAGQYRVLFKRIEGSSAVLVARVIDRKDLERAVATLPEY